MKTIREAGAALRARKISCVELVEEALRKAKERADLNAFITVTAEEARREAGELDRELAAGRDRGPLHGIPVAYKDLFYTKGVRTTNGSKLFADFVPPHDAAVVEKLRAAGAVSIGKLNQHELAYGITSANPHFGPVRNPHDLDCVPGGSSGGSGAAVAASVVYVGMGSDTGGSIRIPAAFCGTVGLKPTFGRVSRHGCFHLGLTLDHMGPLTRSVEDAALVLNTTAGYDGRDEATSRRKVDEYVPRDPSLAGVRVGLPQNFFNERVDAEVWSAFERAVHLAEQGGAEIVPLRVPDVAALNAVARMVLLGEASAVMARHLDRRDMFGADVLALFDQGRLTSAMDYVNAQRLRRVMQREWRGLFDRIDVLVTPATPNPAPRIGQAAISLGGVEEDVRLASTRFVRGVNALGFPALSVPCGRTRAGLPVGLQIVSKPFSEAALLRAGAAMERALGG